ncbi:MAG: MopE-related protein, partial [Myxococcota bacterium]
NGAVAAAADGDTLRVEAGTYAEDIDLRGRDLSLVSADGPARTILSPTNPIRIDDGRLEGFTIAPAPAVAVYVTSGAPSLRELHIESPATHGVSIAGGNPLVEEVGVWNAGLHAFMITGGSPIVQRSVSYGAGNYGFAVKSASTLRSSIAIGGAWGFVFENEASTASNLVAVGTSTGAVAAMYATTITNSAFRDNPVAVRCFSGAAPTFTNGLAWNTATATGCAASVLADVDAVDPGFASWSTTLPFAQIDLRPTGTSPMVNAGTGTDTDGSVADLGAFGGPENDWRDRDGDGYPVLFDCDDHDEATYVYAPERGDGMDNDCDGTVDEDVVVDPGDTGDTATDTGADTDEPSDNTDLDADGFPAATDCDEHNVASYPGARERTDGADNDCDGLVDEGTAAGDDDLDGYTEFGGDCDDTRADRHPGNASNEPDGIDHDCDGEVDRTRGIDADGDDYFDNGGDCDDTDPLTNPGQSDPTDGVDDDCDGLADDDALRTDADGDGQTPEMGDCDDENALVFFGAVDTADDFVDQDCNGTDNYDADRDGDPAPASGGTDCDDHRSTVYPGAPELCGDNADNDCDGVYEEDCDAASTKLTADEEDCGCAAVELRSSLGLGALLATLALSRRRARTRSRSSS